MPETPPIPLETIADAVGPVEVRDPAPVLVADLVYDAHRVTPGSLFVCVPGRRVDGHDFAPDAVARGATALLVERPLALPVPQLVVPDARLAMALAADAFFGRPTRELEVAGVTGTNGKTTTAFVLYSVLAAAGRRPGLLGTVEMRIGGERRAVIRTTPEAIDLQRAFRELLDAGDRSCAMEASSHAVRAEAPGRDALPGARLHEPLPGPPRLPRHPRGVLRRQAAALHGARRGRPPASRRGQRRRRARPAARGGAPRARERAAHLRSRRRRRRAGPRSSS